MLVQMLQERVANGGTYNLTFGESLTMSGIGILVVFLELVILAVIVLLMGKIVSSVAGKKGNARCQSRSRCSAQSCCTCGCRAYPRCRLQCPEARSGSVRCG